MSNLRVGTFCYAIQRGLGHLAKAFYDHGIVTDPFMIGHASIPTVHEWYPKDTPILPIRALNERMAQESMKEFVKGKDVMLFMETPFWPGIIQHCREQEVKTVLLTMYECTHVHHPSYDLYLCPSLLDYDKFYLQGKSVFLPIPVKVPWKQRTKATHYVHNGGYLGLRGREGTKELILAMQYVKSPLKLTLRCQEEPPEDYLRIMRADDRITYVYGTVPYDQLFAEGDVYIAPQKFNGLSLPLQEAYASGMLVMTTDRYPMDTWLPQGPMIPRRGVLKDVRVGPPYMPFEESVVDPKDIAQTMDWFYDKDITRASLMGKEWAEAHSWSALKGEYMNVLEGLFK